MAAPEQAHCHRNWLGLGSDGWSGDFIRWAQPIADSGFGQHELRTFRIGFDLLPELPHIDAQILRIGQFIPQLLQQKLVGQHFAGVLHQHAQQVHTLSVTV